MLFVSVILACSHDMSYLYTSYATSVRGDVKLFDFGLAAIMPKNGDPYEDKFEMSGAGT